MGSAAMYFKIHCYKFWLFNNNLNDSNYKCSYEDVNAIFVFSVTRYWHTLYTIAKLGLFKMLIMSKTKIFKKNDI